MVSTMHFVFIATLSFFLLTFVNISSCSEENLQHVKENIDVTDELFNHDFFHRVSEDLVRAFYPEEVYKSYETEKKFMFSIMKHVLDHQISKTEIYREQACRIHDRDTSLALNRIKTTILIKEELQFIDTVFEPSLSDMLMDLIDNRPQKVIDFLRLVCPLLKYSGLQVEEIGYSVVSEIEPSRAFKIYSTYLRYSLSQE